MRDVAYLAVLALIWAGALIVMGLAGKVMWLLFMLGWRVL